ncbi:MAG TPA: FAD-dependent oxidoreductase [bacterium]|nr:FAD-dependent oxidoreductase [bacterium]HOL34629.1 FAD-dependent oxidoreductase [bacterium]HPP08175.1 FAD-dependent oxidoreductase [bacterium]
MQIQTTVLSNIVRTTSVRSVKVAKPRNVSFLAGQFFKVYSKDGFRYLSVSCSPQRNYLEFTKKITQSEFSLWFTSLKKGDKLIIDGPYGKFTLDPDDRKILFIAGGIGITPIFSMLENAVILKDERDYTLFYGNKNANDIPFHTELQEFASRIHLKIFMFLEQEKQNCYHGYIEIQKIQELLPDVINRTVFICGPTAMVEKLHSDAKKFKVAEKIKIEKLIGY